MYYSFLAVILFFFVLSCGGGGKKDEKSAEVKGYFAPPPPDQAEEPPPKDKKKKKKGRRRVNALKEEESFLSRKRGDDSHFDHSLSDTTLGPICRRFPGCIKFCSKWDSNKACNQWPVGAVLELWSSFIDSYSEEQILQTLNWMAEDQDVSFFLWDSDPEHNIIKKLLIKNSQFSCPLIESADVWMKQQPAEEAETSTALFLAHPEGRDKGLKKVMDSKLYQFDLPVFKGFMTKCLDNKKISFIEKIAQKKNWRGFMMAHQVLAHSCGESEDCMRLAYCKLNAPDVLTEVQSIRKHSAGMEVSEMNCEYSAFNSLPL